MAKISFLIFTIDPYRETLQAIEKIYDVADEVVIVDSSKKSNRSALRRAIKRRQMNKVRVFDFIALGYAEPAYHYGISLCKNEWLFLLDTDEELSAALKQRIGCITDDKKVDVIKIKRYENSKRSFYTWQPRLFRKGKIEHLGFIHNPSIIYGTSIKIKNKEIYMVHRHDIYEHKRDYNRMAIFYKHPYVFLLKEIFLTLNLNKHSILGLRRFSAFIKSKSYLKRTKETEDIAKEIHKDGLIKYLMLDRPETIKKLNRKYAGRKQGIDLLMELIYKKHNGDYP